MAQSIAASAHHEPAAGRYSHARTQVQRLAQFVCGASWQDISEPAREQLKLRVLDSLGVAVGAFDGEPVAMVREQVREFGGAPLATLIGTGRSAPDRAAFYNGALVRYLDFNDSCLAPGETCHPSDNLAPVLAACEYAHADGRTLLCALAVAYQVQTRLCEVAPVRAKGFDHTTQGAYAVAAGVARALGLDEQRTANAIAIAGTSLSALRVTRTGELSHWKGLAYPATAFAATHTAFLAMRGVSGPREVFEGNKGFMQAIAGPFEIDWQHEDLESVRHTILKKYNAEIHSQSAIEALLQLRAEHKLDAATVQQIELDTFQVAYDIIGGGEEGDKHRVRFEGGGGPLAAEGITEEVTSWRTDVVAQIARELGLENVMFEAADPEVFGWYVKNYGPEVNLFVDHSQIVQLECLRRGIWGTESLWGRVTTYPER